MILFHKCFSVYHTTSVEVECRNHARGEDKTSWQSQDLAMIVTELSQTFAKIRLTQFCLLRLMLWLFSQVKMTRQSSHEGFVFDLPYPEMLNWMKYWKKRNYSDNTFSFWLNIENFIWALCAGVNRDKNEPSREIVSWRH